MQTFYRTWRATDITEDRLLDYLGGFGKTKNEIKKRYPKICDITYELISHFIESHGYPSPKKMRILDSHGNTINGNYSYAETINDTTNWYSVQQWINTHSPAYETLFIQPCNPKKATVTSQHALVVYPLGLPEGAECIRAVSTDNTPLTIKPPIISII